MADIGPALQRWTLLPRSHLFPRRKPSRVRLLSTGLKPKNTFIVNDTVSSPPKPVLFRGGALICIVRTNYVKFDVAWPGKSGFKSRRNGQERCGARSLETCAVALLFPFHITRICHSQDEADVLLDSSHLQQSEVACLTWRKPYFCGTLSRIS